MPTSLNNLKKKLDQRIASLEGGFHRQLLAGANARRIDRYAIQEGYVSALWQAWSAFCREVIICSTRGSSTVSGVITNSPHAARSEMEIAFIAKRLAYNKSINAISPLPHHLEHTWGDVQKLHLVASGIGCSNSVQILTALSVCSRIADLQLCRNASAHVGISTIQGVRSARVRYRDTKMHHPSDMMRWIDPDSNDFLWRSWVEEIQIAAEFAIL